MSYEIAAGAVAVIGALGVASLTYLGAQANSRAQASYQAAAMAEAEALKNKNLELEIELEKQRQETARLAKVIDDFPDVTATLEEALK
ncbi:hypothetical protein [Brevundimonas sp.]|uniref:hypothetical protein n=1 Tax=Brevundimonas sp. TaxID=1871086 RepID=UPI0028B07DA2|nr:hypothetical protein [Brevundimonas sp.]